MRSVEDHGYIMDYGVAGRSGFLLHKNAAEFITSCNDKRPLHVGQVVLCCVLPGAQARAGPVTVNPSTIFSSLMSSDRITPLSALLPGMLVGAAVKQVATCGLTLSFLGGFEGSTSWRHLASKQHSPEQYSVGKKCKARVLWVDIASKKIGLTLQQEIVSGTGFSFGKLQIGNIFHEARVLTVDQPIAILLVLSDTAYGYAPIQLVYSSREEKFRKQHSQGSTHPCRIVNFNLLDGVAIVSLQQSVLEKPFMKYSDVPVGQVVEGEIDRVLDQGLLVSLTDSIRAFCPSVHMSDLTLRHPRRKLKEGNKVKCRVLRVDIENRGLLVTLKKSLVKSELPPLVTYSEAVPGSIHEGTVVSVQPYGLIVRFYGEVKGLVQKTELSSTQIIPDPSEVFRQGQVVQCRVLSCEPASKRLSLSLRCDVPPPSSGTPSESFRKHPATFIPGQVFDDLMVTAVASSGLTLQHPSSQELAILPTEMLSDYASFCPILLNYHSQNLEKASRENRVYTIQEVVIVSSQSASQSALASTKRLLMQEAQNQSSPTCFTDLKVMVQCWNVLETAVDLIPFLYPLQVGMVVPGYIKKQYSYGSFVQLPHGLVGLAPIKYLKDEFISDATSVFRDMQTVLAKVKYSTLQSCLYGVCPTS